MREIIEIDPNNRRQARQFLGMPFKIYKKTPQWVPMLEMDARRMLDRRNHPFYHQGEAAFFIAVDAGETIARLAILAPHEKSGSISKSHGSFYLFECIDDQNLAVELFERGFQWARAHHLERIGGPKGFTELDGTGVLVRGFEHRPALGMPYNPPYYSTLVEAAGFRPVGGHVSGFLQRTAQFPERITAVAELLKQRRGLHVAKFRSRREFRAMVPRIQAVYNLSMQGTNAVDPITDDEVKALADQLMWFADPGLIKIVLKGEQVVGFLFAYPDISAAIQRTRGKVWPFGWIDLLLELRQTEWININGMGMAEGYRGVGGTALLFSEMHKSIIENRYKYVDVVQIGLENDRMLREMENFGIDFYKEHRMYEVEL